VLCCCAKIECWNCPWTLKEVAPGLSHYSLLFAEEIGLVLNERTNNLPILFQNRAQVPPNNCSIPDDWLYPLCKHKIEVTTLYMVKGAFNQFCKTSKKKCLGEAKESVRSRMFYLLPIHGSTDPLIQTGSWSSGAKNKSKLNKEKKIAQHLALKRQPFSPATCHTENTPDWGAVSCDRNLTFQFNRLNTFLFQMNLICWHVPSQKWYS